MMDNRQKEVAAALEQVAATIDSDKYEVVSLEELSKRKKTTPDIDFKDLLRQVKENIENGIDVMYLPLEIELGTKKNKIRLVPNDSNAPLGNVVKSGQFAYMAFAPYATGRFSVFDLLPYCVWRVAHD